MMLIRTCHLAILSDVCLLKALSRFVRYAKILFDNFWHTPRD